MTLYTFNARTEALGNLDFHARLGGWNVPVLLTGFQG